MRIAASATAAVTFARLIFLFQVRKTSWRALQLPASASRGAMTRECRPQEAHPYSRSDVSFVFFQQEIPIPNKPRPTRNVATGPRMNERIRITPVRVVSADGTMLGEMATTDALNMAIEAGLDLVEVSADARPPVCRIMNYGKAQYEQKKKQSGSAKNRSQLKQIRLRVKIGQHDIDFKTRKARDFLARRNKVKINVMFRGRENAHHERGRQLLDEVVKSLEDIASVEQPIKMEGGRAMSVLLIPNAKAGR